MLATLNSKIRTVETLFEKGSSRLNEDYCFAEDGFFGVFDGATSLTREKFPSSLTGGFMASNIAGKRFLKNNDTIANLAQKANDEIRCEMARHNIDFSDRTRLWSTSLAVGRIEGDCLHWAQIGDCSIVVIHDDGSFCDLVQIRNHDLETLFSIKKAGQGFEKPLLPEITGQIEKVRAKMNIDYGVLNGEKTALSFLETGVLPLEGVSHILFFTDGLSLPRTTPSPIQDNTMIARLFLEGGLDHVRNTIRTKEASDASGLRYPRFKPHDDIAAVAVSFDVPA